jgi:hypothetical protein
MPAMCQVEKYEVHAGNVLNQSHQGYGMLVYCIELFNGIYNTKLVTSYTRTSTLTGANINHVRGKYTR